MRFSQGGGPPHQRQAFRERTGWWPRSGSLTGASNVEVAEVFRVSVRSVQRWRRAWRGAGAGAERLRSAGPVSRTKLSEALFAVLEQELSKGPVAHGWPKSPVAQVGPCLWRSAEQPPGPLEWTRTCVAPVGQ
ncbi:helix-turn-helix domain-containing protein [Streptomyces nigra]